MKQKIVSHKMENIEPLIATKSIPLNIQNNISTLKFNGPLNIVQQANLITLYKAKRIDI